MIYHVNVARRCIVETIKPSERRRSWHTLVCSALTTVINAAMNIHTSSFLTSFSLSFCFPLKTFTSASQLILHLGLVLAFKTIKDFIYSLVFASFTNSRWEWGFFCPFSLFLIWFLKTECEIKWLVNVVAFLCDLFFFFRLLADQPYPPPPAPVDAPLHQNHLILRYFCTKSTPPVG